jgi:hypothetical protein
MNTGNTRSADRRAGPEALRAVNLRPNSPARGQRDRRVIKARPLDGGCSSAPVRFFMMQFSAKD